MENDNQLGLIYLKEKDYFILEYPNQSLKHNKNFKDFKAQKLNELGEDAKLFKCKIDNILFYIQKKDNETFPYYYKKCPAIFVVEIQIQIKENAVLEEEFIIYFFIMDFIFSMKMLKI